MVSAWPRKGGGPRLDQNQQTGLKQQQCTSLLARYVALAVGAR